MRTLKSWAIRISLAAVAASLRAQIVLTNSDVATTSSFHSSLNWSDGLAPHGDAPYLVNAGLILRTPEGAGSYVFGGASLALDNGFVNLKGTGNVTVPDLRLYGCRLAQGINGTAKVYGTNVVFGTLAAPSRYSGSLGRMTHLYAVLQGGGEFQVERTAGENSGDFACRLYADNSAFTGRMTVVGSGIKIGIASAASLGGERADFTPDALTLKNGGTLYCINAVTLSAATRGITVSGGGTLDASYADFTIAEPVAGTGTLSVRGGGYTLTLNAALTLDGDIDVITTGRLALGPNFSLSANRKIVLSGGSLTGTNPAAQDLSLTGGAINPGTVGGVGSLAVSNLYYASGAFEFDFAPGATSDFLRVDGALTRAAGVPFTVRLTKPVTNETGRFALMTAANMGDYTTNDFRLVSSYYGLPEGWLELADEGAGTTLFFTQARPVVALISSGNNAADSFYTGSRWSDGQVPNANNDYVVASGYRLRTDDASAAAETRTRVFGGRSLTLAEGADLRCKGQRAVVSDLRLYSQRITHGTPPYTQYLGGSMAIQGAYDFENDGSLSRVLVIDSQLSGTNDIRFKISVENPQYAVNGKFALTAANTNFTGAITVLGTNLTYLILSDERNLGGNPAAFRANQLALDCTGILQVATSVVLDDPNRGITLSRQGGILDVVSNSATLAVACPVAGTKLYKRGAGTLALSGANTYSGGTVVEAGALEVGSSNALGSGSATFYANTALRVRRDAAALPLGVRLGGTSPLTVSGPLPVIPLFGEGALPKVFDLPIFLLTGTTNFNTALLSPQGKPAGYDMTLGTRTVDDGVAPRTQVYLHYRFGGLVLLVQ